MSTYQVNDKLYFISDMDKGDILLSGVVVQVGDIEDNKIHYIIQFPEDADPDTSIPLYALTHEQYVAHYNKNP